MPHVHSPASQNPAIVARSEVGRSDDRYLRLSPSNAVVWVADPATATPFASMREATRMASRLPAALRAFSLPRDPELAVANLH